jgi:hypothetical protein
LTYENCEAALRSFCRRRPFLPFLVELNSGDRLQVNHPEALAWRGHLLYYASPQRKHRLFDGSSVCQVLDTA